MTARPLNGIVVLIRLRADRAHGAPMRQGNELRILQVDAFTDTPYGGNPAVVVLDADRIDEAAMLRLSREMSGGQTVFVYSSKVADWYFRYMTPGGEMAFSGHLTVGAFTALIEEGLAEVVGDVSTYTLETKAGLRQVEIVKNETTGMHEIQITHDRPKFMNTYDPKEYAQALGLTLADILAPNPVQTVSTGTPQVMIPVTGMRALERIHPNWDRLNELQNGSDWVSLQVFSRQTLEETSDVHVRHFAPALGINEDPVTGSAAGSMGSYLIKYGIIAPSIPVTSIVIEQGHFMKRPGRIFVEVQGDPNEIKQVKVSGTGVTVMRGVMYI